MIARRLLPTIGLPTVGTVLVAALLGSACTSDPDPSPPLRPATSTTPAPPTPDAVDAPSVGRLVTLGDSYTAGPGVGAADPASGFCVRSAGSWPTLLADLTSAELTDVSCSGATTYNAFEPTPGQDGERPAQLDAVTPDADVVTVQLGGNDGNLFLSLVQACAESADACGAYVDRSVPQVLATTTNSVAEVLRRAKVAAPEAKVILVGYLRIAPAEGSCAAGLPTGDASNVREAEEAIDAALADAARRADVTYVSMSKASVGHDACAGADAWTNAQQVPDGDGIGFHPRAAGMKAVAEQVALALR